MIIPVITVASWNLVTSFLAILNPMHAKIMQPVSKDEKSKLNTILRRFTYISVIWFNDHGHRVSL